MCPELPRIRTSRLLLAALQPEQASALSRLADEFCDCSRAPIHESMRRHSSLKYPDILLPAEP